MKAADAKPSKAHLTQRVNNRIGAVIEAVENYIEKRKASNSSDLISIISFDDKVLLSLEAIKVTDFNPKSLETVQPLGGTAFDPPLIKAEEILQRNPPIHHVPFIFFLSDGGGTCSEGLKVVQRLKTKFPNFRLDSLIFGSDTSGEKILGNLASAGGGNLLKTAASLKELEQVMEAMDMSF